MGLKRASSWLASYPVGLREHRGRQRGTRPTTPSWHGWTLLRQPGEWRHSPRDRGGPISEIATPTLVVISGPAGSGKTTLAHELARAIRCPAICRDEIKEGMVHATGAFQPAWGDPFTKRAFPTFFGVLRLLLEQGVTVVADAAFQDGVWRPRLEQLAGLARLRIVQCHTDVDVARDRVVLRAPMRNAHADGPLMESLESGRRYYEAFVRVRMPVPSLDVDTTDGYRPRIDEIVEFIDRPQVSTPPDPGSG